MRCLNLLIVSMSFVHPAVTNASDTQKPSKLDPESARMQITQALERVEESPEQALEDLRGILDRTEDESMISIGSYNLGVLYQSAESFEDAARAFQRADLLGTENTLRANARFNLGHTLYAKTKSTEDPKSIEDIEQRIEGLLQTARAFRSVLEITPDHRESAMNTERVRREIHQLREIKQQLEQQKQRMDDLADQLKQQAEQQQQQSQNTQESPPQDGESQKQQQQDQKELSEQTADTNDQLEQTSPESSAEEDIQDAMEAQKQAQDAMERGDQELAAQKQQEAAEKLNEASEKIQREADELQKGDQGNQSMQNDESKNKQESNEGESEGESETESDQIDQLAQDLLEKERREREQRTYRAKGRPVRVEKDW